MPRRRVEHDDKEEMMKKQTRTRSSKTRRKAPAGNKAAGDARWENDWQADRYEPSPYLDSDNSVVTV